MTKQKGSGASGGAAPVVKVVSIDDLVPDPRNARVRGERAKATLAGSTRAFGFARSIVADGGNVIRAGNGTLEAARAAGVREALVIETDGTRPVVVKRSGWTDHEATAYGVADNFSSDLSTFSGEALQSVMRGLAEHAVAVGDRRLVDAVGFSDADLAALFELGKVPQHARAADVGGTRSTEDVDEIPAPPTTPTTRTGDVWLLGDHRLVCGDCREQSTVDAAFETDRWDLLITDPPYGVSYASKNKTLVQSNQARGLSTEIENDAGSLAEMNAMRGAAFKGVRRVGRPGASYYVTGPSGDLMLELLLAMRESDLPLRHMLIWAKSSLVLGRADYHYKHEPIFFGWIEGAAHHAIQNRAETSVWEIDKPTRSDLHPTMKPVELYARAMRNSSTPGAIVAEPFAGSGTAIVAAEQMGRRARAIELSPHYCDVIVSRWERLTGKKADRRQVSKDARAAAPVAEPAAGV